jgi:hypothetical protein
VKKIVIVFKGRFKKEEVASLSAEAIRAVRGAFGSQILGSQIPGSQIPGSQIPGSQIPGSQIPGSQIPGSQIPGSQIPGSHPSVIVHCDFKSEPTSLIVCHAYGFDLDEGPKVEEIAIDIVSSVWNGGRWRSSDRQEDATCEEG